MPDSPTLMQKPGLSYLERYKTWSVNYDDDTEARLVHAMIWRLPFAEYWRSEEIRLTLLIPCALTVLDS